ncbi:MAG TPA: hypothetical protein VMW00_03340 [Dehalococcoidales bacterium]|nr:hypothetical protein [Dehalococcoidales bacterium]
MYLLSTVPKTAVPDVKLRLPVPIPASLCEELIVMEDVGRAIRVANCPVKLEVCFSSCYWRRGDKCIFGSQRGRRIRPMVKKKK